MVVLTFAAATTLDLKFASNNDWEVKNMKRLSLTFLK